MAEDPQAHLAFVANPAAEGKWFADLYQLARQRLARHGVTQVYGGNIGLTKIAVLFLS